MYRLRRLSMRNVLPRKTPSEFNRGLNNRSAIYTPFAQAIPNVPVIDRDIVSNSKPENAVSAPKVCAAGAIDYDQKDEVITQKYGAIVVATGFDMISWINMMNMLTTRARTLLPLLSWNVS